MVEKSMIWKGCVMEGGFELRNVAVDVEDLTRGGAVDDRDDCVLHSAIFAGQSEVAVDIADERGQ